MLDIKNWINELADDLQTTQHLIEPLRRLGKATWADELTNDVQNIREAMEVLRRLQENRGKRRGRPPLWLVKRNPASEPDEKPLENKGLAKTAGA